MRTTGRKQAHLVCPTRDAQTPCRDDPKGVNVRKLVEPGKVIQFTPHGPTSLAGVGENIHTTLKNVRTGKGEQQLDDRGECEGRQKVMGDT